MPALIGARRQALYGGVPGWMLAAYGAVARDVTLAAHFDADRYFVKGRGEVPLSSILSVSRASTGYAQNAAGVLVPYAAHTPRLGIGLLPEEARTNIAVQSQTFGTSWTTTDTTVSSNSIAAPDGTITADTLTQGSAGTAIVSESLPIAANTTYTGTFFLKRNNNDWVCVVLFNSTDQLNVWVNLATGALGTVTASGTASGIVASVTALANGWYRVRVSGIVNAASTSALLAFLQVPSDGSVLRQNGAAVYAWGAQLELGAFPTSYIPTTTVAVARAADVPSLIGPALTAALNAKAAFFQTNGANLNSVGAAGLLVYGTAPGWMLYNTSSSARITADNFATATSATFGSGTIAGVTKTAFGFDGAGTTAIANGGSKATTAAAWSASGTATVGNRSIGDRALNGYMLRFSTSQIKGAFDGMTA